MKVCHMQSQINPQGNSRDINELWAPIAIQQHVELEGRGPSQLPVGNKALVTL